MKGRIPRRFPIGGVTWKKSTPLFLTLVVRLKKGLRIITRNRYSLLAGVLGERESLAELLPPLIRRGKGPYLYDYDGNRYVDFYLAHGALTLGHTPAGVTKIMKGWLSKGFSPGYLAGSHALISKKLAGILTAQAGITDRRVWLFFDSACQAVSALTGLLQLAGLTGEWAYIAGRDTGSDHRDLPPGFSKKILPSELAGAELPPSSCALVRVDGGGWAAWQFQRKPGWRRSSTCTALRMCALKLN